MKKNPIKKIITAVNTLGFYWIIWRIKYFLLQKTVFFRKRFPIISLDDLQFQNILIKGIPTDPTEYKNYREKNAPHFFFNNGLLPDKDRLLQITNQSGYEYVINIANNFCRGIFLYFSHQKGNLGKPVNWLLNPFTNVEYNAHFHWTLYPTFSSSSGDIKIIWEPSRFACAFWLVRAYALTGDEKYPESFWELFESWCIQNPPNSGPNWKCGQEISLRIIAWCFALYGFWEAKSSTGERIVNMIKVISLQAERIEKNIDYAISQKNNHAISEAVGLLTTGILFPELKKAKQWLKLGKNVFEKELMRQIYDDGSYVQHSMNYHRLMLHNCIWAIRLAKLNKQPLSNKVIIKVAKAGEFLFQMLDFKSGRVPNYGANDGAHILPLTSCDYLDYRPTVQSIQFLLTGQRALSSGPWDEMLLWLFGNETEFSKIDNRKPNSCRFDNGGYYTLRAQESWCMIRCHTYKDRPVHVDMLHVDLWYKGFNIFSDSGTYRYYVPEDPQFERYFKDIQAHNTIEIDAQGPLKLFSRFLWLPWPKAKCLDFKQNYWQGEHYAYNSKPHGIIHRRSVNCIGENTWIVTDELSGKGEHRITLRWHLIDSPYHLNPERSHINIDLPFGKVSLQVKKPDTINMNVNYGLHQQHHISGWSSEYYNSLMKRPTIEINGICSLPAKLITEIELSVENK